MKKKKLDFVWPRYGKRERVRARCDDHTLICDRKLKCFDINKFIMDIQRGSSQRNTTILILCMLKLLFKKRSVRDIFSEKP